MNKLFSAVLLAGGAFAVHSAQAACNYPLAPGQFPDGSVASRDEMLAAKKQFQQYDADINTYLVCIRAELDEKFASTPDLTADRRAKLEKVLAQKEDAALAEAKDVAARLNKQLAAWTEKNKPAAKS